MRSGNAWRGWNDRIWQNNTAGVVQVETGNGRFVVEEKCR